MQINIKTKVTQGGRIVIPADIRRQLGIEIGDDVSLSVDKGSVKVMTQKESIRQAQALFRSVVPEGSSIVDELIADRRRESENE